MDRVNRRFPVDPLTAISRMTRGWTHAVLIGAYVHTGASGQHVAPGMAETILTASEQGP